MRRIISFGLWLLVIAILLLLPTPASSQLPTPRQSAASLESQGDELRQKLDYSEALVCYRAALAQSPRNAHLWNKTGMAELQLNHIGAAQTAFRRALKLDGRLAQAHNNAGVTRYIRKDFKGAIKEYERALAIEPESASFHNNLAAALFERHQTERAMAEYARAFQLDPLIFERTSRFGSAAQMRSPEDRAAFYYIVAKLYAKSGNVDGALEYLKKAFEEGFKDTKKVYEDNEFAELRADPRLELIVKRKAEELK